MKTFSLQDEIKLNYDVSSICLDNKISSLVLNYDFVNNNVFITLSSDILNFELRDYDETYIIFKILLDFIESLSVGDIF